jgi:hypothetical protein
MDKADIRVACLNLTTRTAMSDTPEEHVSRARVLEAYVGEEYQERKKPGPKPGTRRKLTENP